MRNAVIRSTNAPTRESLTAATCRDAIEPAGTIAAYLLLVAACMSSCLCAHDNLSKTQASEIRSYIRAKAREVLGKRKPSEQSAAGRF